MTISTQAQTFFTALFAKHILDRCDIKNSESISFYAISPPLIPEKAFDLQVARNSGYFNMPPIGPMYLCASIDTLGLEGVETTVIDLNNLLLKNANTSSDFHYNSWTEALNLHEERDRQLVFLVSYMFGTTKECYINTVNYLRARYPRCLIVTGGVQATFDKDEILTSGHADIASLHEGELQIQFLALLLTKLASESDLNSFLESKQGLEPPGGLCFKLNNDIIESGVPTQPVEFDWDISKFYDQILIGDYNKYGGIGPFSKFVESLTGRRHKYSTILTKRGCRANCAFCTVRTFNGKGLRFRSINSVTSEIDYLYKKGITYIDFLDDDLLNNEKHMIQLFNEISVKFPDLVWTTGNGLIGVAITEKLMEAMSNSGLKAFKIGVESGNSQVIKNIRKPTTLWRLLEKSELIRKYPHIFFSANFIVGFPEETFSQMMDSFIFARRLASDWASFYVCQPLKGTDLYSSFQNLMDPRATNESYDKVINPGRSAARGEFAYSEGKTLVNSLNADWSIFDLPANAVFTTDEHNEIWFTFNLVANFLDNPAFRSRVSSEKLYHWLKAIQTNYPYDASMSAALTHICHIIQKQNEFIHYQQLTTDIISRSTYWQFRASCFPEILTLAHILPTDPLPVKLGLTVPTKLVPSKYKNLFDARECEREANGWRD